MPRTFSSQFSAEKNKKTAKPFLTAIFRSPIYGNIGLIGRSIAGIGAEHPVIGGLTHFAIVKTWGTLGAAFGQQIDAIPDQPEIQITCSNFPVIGGARLSDFFMADLESIPVDFFWNFLVGTTVYQETGPSGAAKMPTSWGYRQVTLSIGSLMDHYFSDNVLTEVTAEMFPNAPQASLRQPIAIAIGDTTAANVDGARIPAVCVDLGQGSTVKNGLEYVTLRTGGRRTAYVACETKTNLVAASVGSIYWNGHKIVETPDFHMSTTGGSKTVSLNVLASGQTFTSAGKIPDVFDVGFFGSFNSVRLGADSSRIAHIVQPFVADGHLEIVDAALNATKYDVADPTAFGPLRSLVMAVYNDEDAAGDGGILTTPSALLADLHRARRRSDAYDVQTAQSDVNAFAPFENSTYFNMHAYSPTPGVQHYAIAHIGGLSAGIASKPDQQWYNVQIENTVGTSTATPVYSGIRLNQPAYAVDFDGTVIPLGDAYMPVRFNTLLSSLTTNVITDDGGTDQTVGATGIFHMGIEPEETIAVGMVKLLLRKQKPTGALDSPTLKGSITISIVELDALGMEVTQIASAEFQSDEYNDLLSDSSYADAIKTFSSTALLLAGHRYKVRIDGQVDIDGQFSGWVVKAITAADFSDWVAANALNLSTTASSSAFSTGGTQRQLVTTNETDTCSIDLTLYTVRFNRSVQSVLNPSTGEVHSFWMLEALCGPADSVYFVPEGTNISTDIHCTTTRPDQVIHALANLAGAPDGRIDLAGSFTAAGTAYGSVYKFRGAITQQQTYKALFTRMAFEARSEISWDFDKFQLKYLPAPGDVVTPVRTVTLPDIPRGSPQDPLPDFHIVRTETTDIVNVVPILYQRMFDQSGQNAYILGDEFYSVPSIAAHKQRRRDDLFQLDYVRDTTMAEGIGLFYILWLAFPRLKPIFTTKLTFLEIENGDVVAIDLTPIIAAPGGGDVLGGGGAVGGDGYLGDTGAFQGWLSQPVLVRAVQYDWSTQRIQFTGVDQA